MYISTKHYLSATVYVYDEAADSVRRGTIKAISAQADDNGTAITYTVQFKDVNADDTPRHDYVDVSDEAIFDSAESAFYSPTLKQYQAEIAAEDAAAALNAAAKNEECIAEVE